MPPALILAVLAGCGGGGNTAGTGTQVAAPPATLAVSPSSVTESAMTTGSASPAGISTYVDGAQGSKTYWIVVTWTGKGIASVSQVSVPGGTTIALAFKSPATLGPGTYTDTVTVAACYDQSCGQQISGSPSTIPVTYTVTQGPSQPSSLDPASVPAGSAGFTLQVNGSGFTSQSVVEWDGSARPTTFVGPGELTAQIGSGDVAPVTNAAVTVQTPGPFGPGSPLPFVMAGVEPASVAAGGTGLELTVLGTGFDSSSVVLWNGSARPTTLVSATELLAQIPAADIATAATAAVTVQSSKGSWAAGSVAVQPPPIDDVAFRINPAQSGAIRFNNVSLPTASSWSTDVGGRPSYALIAGGDVYVTVAIGDGSKSELLALDQRTGTAVWGPITLGAGANAGYADGTVFVVSSAPNQTTLQPPLLQAYDARSGTLKWTASLPTGEYAAGGPPVAAHGLVFQASIGGLYVFSESNGDMAWLGGGGGAAPAVTADGVYSSPACITLGVRPATGESIWSYPGSCGGGGGGTTPAAADGVLYSLVSGSSGGLAGVRLDAGTGKLLGSYPADAALAVSGQTAYFLEGGTLSAFDPGTGSVIWTFTGDGQLTTAPIVVNQYVFVGSSAGNLYALDSATGQVLWQASLAGAIAPEGNPGLLDQIQSGLAAGDGLLVVPDGTSVTAYTLSANP